MGSGYKQCKHVRSDGSRCTRDAREGEKYCGMCKGQIIAAAERDGRIMAIPRTCYDRNRNLAEVGRSQKSNQTIDGASMMDTGETE